MPRSSCYQIYLRVFQMWVTSPFYVHFLRRFALLVLIPILYDHVYLINMLVNNLKQTFVGICGFLPNSENTPNPYVRAYTRPYTRIISITKASSRHSYNVAHLSLSVGSFGAELSTDVVRKFWTYTPEEWLGSCTTGPVLSQ